MEFSEKLNVTEEQINQLEMHSVINVLSVIMAQLQVIQLSTNHPELLDGAVQKTEIIIDAARQQNREVFNTSSFDGFKDEVFTALFNLKKIQPVLSDDTPVNEYISIFKDIFDVAAVRISELQSRWNSPDHWQSFTTEEFRADFKKFFHAMEKNSKGSYRIIYNIAEKEEKDYLIQFEVSGDENNEISLPILLKDIIRDLIANSRKYTPPGGRINIGISQKNDAFRFVVEDNGYGIPPDELPEIVEFGYRGSNVESSIRTMGGGFGLTKALYVTQKYEGKLWIDSELDKGTTITLEIPIKKAAAAIH
ncbi:MAG TPA: ATP-binding protein [Balneolaceae bacterium]|nr:ATP-binding protein [Balneolaceae bacterium]